MTQEAKQRALEKVLAGIAMIKEDHGDEHPSDYSFEVLGSMLFDHLDTIRECLSQPATPEGWKPIETAPKDGTEFLVIYCRQGNVMQLVRWNTIHKYWQSKGKPELGLENNATHWMPLPAAPVHEEKV